MTTMISYAFLQHYWWIIISVLAGLLVFLMFVQGGQSLIFSLPKTDLQKTLIVNALGRKWEFTFTTLVTFGGAFFASFPLFYATSFGGAYWVWIAILLSFIVQAIAYEYRSKPGNVFGQKTYDIFLFINGALGPFLIGTAVGTFFTGSNFSLNYMFSVTWGTAWHGLEAVLDARNVALGLAVLMLTRCNGLLYLINTIDDDDLAARSQSKLKFNGLAFLVFFLFFAITLLFSDGLTFKDGRPGVEDFKYLHNFLQMPLVLLIFLLGVAGVLAGLFVTIFKGSRKGIWYSGAGTVLTTIALFLLAGFNNTAFYPSYSEFVSSLTIYNSSSSKFTLTAMTYVSFAIPFVLAYIWYFWRAMNSKKVNKEDLEGEGHVY
jgi:cytochrome bd ubiquinol oxidase subunit II